jgi:hypothetical protein
MDSNGDREPNFDLWQLEPDAEFFSVFASLSMADVESPVRTIEADFTRNVSSLPSQQMKELLVAAWYTPSNDPPPVVPECGLMNELCSSAGESYTFFVRQLCMMGTSRLLVGVSDQSLISGLMVMACVIFALFILGTAYAK